jgi:hypothetical protein
MSDTNRFMTELPASVLDRFYAEHPDEVDDRPKSKVTEANEQVPAGSRAALDDPFQVA